MTANDRPRYYLTTPIYYVNDVPHLGHAYTTIAADVAARFRRMRGYDVFFLTGTDEHGQKVARSAAQRGVSEREYTDAIHEQFKALWERFGISNDAFIRTSDAEHVAIVQEALQRLWDRGFVYEQEYEGWYNVSDEMFVTDEAEIERLRAGGRVELVSERNYFFRMSQFQDRLRAEIESGERFSIFPESRRNEVLGFLRQPLGDLSISRPKSRLSWGVELPFDREHVCYVWVDALLNYCSGLAYLRGEGSFEDGFAPFWPADAQFIGKDILTTHSVYWTTLLMALELPLPRVIFSHGWWLFDGQKMSKSIGNVVDPNRLVDEFGVDPIRYYVLREVPFGQDGDFSAQGLAQRINSDLANALGNLASRVLNLVQKAGGHWPERPQGVEVVAPLEEALVEAARRFDEEIEAHRFSHGLQVVWQLLGRANELVQHTAPWTLLKQLDDPAARRTFDAIIESAGSTLATVAALLAPFMPTKMDELWGALGEDGSLADYRYGSPDRVLRVRAGAVATKGPSLFPRLDPDTVKSFADRAQELESEGVPGRPEEGLVTIGDFTGLELRVATVLAAERVPKSKKLLRLRVGVGTEDGLPVRRQVVAGIAEHYTPEELVGRQVIVVFNLEPATLMGIESQGMLLAADTEDGGLELATFAGTAREGARVR